MNKAILLSTAFIASAAISWIVASPGAPQPQRGTEQAATPPPRPQKKLTRAQVDADPAYQGALDKIRAATTTRDRLLLTYDLAHSIPDEDVEKWLNGSLFKENEDPELLRFFRSILFGRFSTIDPEKCAIALSKRGEIGLRGHAQRWAAEDHQAVLALAEKTSDTNARGTLMAAGLYEVAKRDPAALLPILERENLSYVRLEQVMTALNGAGRTMLLEWADHPRQEERRDNIRKSITETWMAQDFNAALAWAEKQEDARHLLPGALSRLGLTPSGYMDKVGNLPPDLLQPVLSAASKRGEDLHEWLAWDYEGKAGLSPEQAKKIRLSAIHRLAYTDTRKALEALKTYGMPDPDTDPVAFRILISQTNRAFEAMGGEVLEEWKALLGPHADEALKTAYRPEPPLNFPVPPADAVREMGETGKTKDKGFLIRWSREELGQAIETLPTLTVPQLENLDDFVSRFNGGPEADFHAAILLEGARKDADFSRFSYANVGFRLAQQNTANATAWAHQMPEGRGRDLAIRGITAHLYGGGAGQAEKWMADLDPRDRKAAEEVIHHIQTFHAND